MILSYEYMDSFKKFKGLPSKDKVYNSMTRYEISDKNYEHFVSVLKKFEIKTMKDYPHAFLLKCDVLLLAGGFWNFRTKSINYFKLDLINYLSLPSYSWDEMLRFTGAWLELISDIEKHQHMTSNHDKGWGVF